jgi:hypothetical protein
LDGDVHGGDVESLEHDLGHLLSVGLGVEGSSVPRNSAYGCPRAKKKLF